MTRLRRWWRALIAFGMQPIEVRLGERATRLEQMVMGLAERGANAEAALMRAVLIVSDRQAAHDFNQDERLLKFVQQLARIEGRLDGQKEGIVHYSQAVADIAAKGQEQAAALSARMTALSLTGQGLAEAQAAATATLGTRLDAVLGRLDVVETQGAQLDERFRHVVATLTGKSATEITSTHEAREPRRFDHTRRQ